MGWINNLFSPSDPEAPRGDPERILQVNQTLDRLRPHFQADGGDIRLVRVDEFGWVEVSMHGACNGCSASSLTLRGAIEPELKREFDWVEGVRAV